MWKDEFIEKYGVKKYEKRLANSGRWQKNNPGRQREHMRKWQKNNPEKVNESSSRWQKNNPGKVNENHRAWYREHPEYNRTGLRGDRMKIRNRDGYRFRPFKKVIAVDTQIHHEWLPTSDEYTFSALVEAKPHRQNIIKPLIILEGVCSFAEDCNPSPPQGI